MGRVVASRPVPLVAGESEVHLDETIACLPAGVYALRLGDGDGRALGRGARFAIQR